MPVKTAPVTSQTQTRTFDGPLFLNLTARDRDSFARVFDALEKQAAATEDYVVDAEALSFVLTQIEATPDDTPDAPARFEPRLALSVPNSFGDIPMAMAFPMYDTAHEQLATQLQIPLRYYRDLLTSDPELLVTNMTGRRGRMNRDKHLVRVMGGIARAVVSGRYRPLDNSDLVNTVLTAAKETQSGVIRAFMSPDTFGLTLARQDWPLMVTTANNVTRGREGEMIPIVTCRNSETGGGGLKVTIGLFSHICQNCMVWETIVDKRHVGTSLDTGTISIETRQAQAAAIWREVADVVRKAWNKDRFEAMVARLNNAADEMLEDPQAAVEKVGRDLAFNPDQTKALINELIKPTVNLTTGGSVYDLFNALTFTAQGLKVDEMNKVEEYAGQLVRVGVSGVKTKPRNGRSL